MAKLLTHEQFIEKLRVKNPTFFDNYEILGQYINNRTRILVKSKYGIHSCMIPQLNFGYLPDIETAINKTEYFINYSKDINPHIFDSIESIIEYKNCEHILVNTKFGVCKTSSHNLKLGKTPCIRTAINKTEYFINQAREIHGDKYDYSLVNWKNDTTKVNLIWNNKIVEQTPASHLTGADHFSIPRKINSVHFDNFLVKAKKVHNNLYTYENTNYINNRTSIQVTCKIHGDFPIIPYIHQKGGKCNKCNEQFNTFRYTDWINKGLQSKNFIGFQVYIIHCCNNEEEFYKIGKTFIDVSQRFSDKEKMPYNYEIIHSIINEGLFICYLEHNLHLEFKDYNYTPLIKFGGSTTECFKFDDIQAVIDFANNFKM